MVRRIGDDGYPRVPDDTRAPSWPGAFPEITVLFPRHGFHRTVCGGRCGGPPVAVGQFLAEATRTRCLTVSALALAPKSRPPFGAGSQNPAPAGPPSIAGIPGRGETGVGKAWGGAARWERKAVRRSSAAAVRRVTRNRLRVVGIPPRTALVRPADGLGPCGRSAVTNRTLSGHGPAGPPLTSRKGPSDAPAVGHGGSRPYPAPSAGTAKRPAGGGLRQGFDSRTGI